MHAFIKSIGKFFPEKCQEEKMNKYQEFYESIFEVAAHPMVRKMKQYQQHGKTDCYHHCLHVAYYNFRICRFLGLRADEAARAGMLHDLFLYDWHTHAKETGRRFHGFTHPRTAMKNAEKIFMLSDLERDIILKHMWPLTITPPKYPETVIICLVDKACSICEVIEDIGDGWRRRMPWKN